MAKSPKQRAVGVVKSKHFFRALFLFTRDLLLVTVLSAMIFGAIDMLTHNFGIALLSAGLVAAGLLMSPLSQHIWRGIPLPGRRKHNLWDNYFKE